MTSPRCNRYSRRSDLRTTTSSATGNGVENAGAVTVAVPSATTPPTVALSTAEAGATGLSLPKATPAADSAKGISHELQVYRMAQIIGMPQFPGERAEFTGR